MQTQQAGPHRTEGRERPHEGFRHNAPPTPVRPAFTELIDAKAASLLLGVPHTWLLAQARQNRIPHHRLGHYVRFDPDALKHWLDQTRIEPITTTRRRR